jgi:uncharacterized protein
VVCAAERVPPGVRADQGWRALAVAGPLDLSMTGVLLSLLEPLARAGVSIFAVSTYDTDHVLVRADRLDDAVAALRAAGHRVEGRWTEAPEGDRRGLEGRTRGAATP